jgi:ABC-type polysaccharide/polyol phosphate export permease
MQPDYVNTLADVTEGIAGWRLWGRLGWQEVKRRYRRTAIGPLWTTLSLGLFILTLGFVWAELWNQDWRQYLPYLCAGMIPWVLVSSVVSEGCTAFTANVGIITSMRFPFTVFTCTVVWRNVIVFFHNLLIFIIVAVVCRVAVTWETLLVIPGLVLFCVNAVWLTTLLGLTCTRFRDITPLVTSLLQISMFVTPIFWAPNQLSPEMAVLVDANLLYHFLDAIRSPLLGIAPSLWTYEMILLTTVFGWTVTWLVFSRFKRRVAYWI